MNKIKILVFVNKTRTAYNYDASQMRLASLKLATPGKINNLPIVLLEWRKPDQTMAGTDMAQG